MHIRIFSALLFIVACSFAQKNDKDYNTAFEFAEVWLDAQRAYDELPGLTAVVVEDQQQLWSYATGMANREGNTAASPATLFSICSISKLFTAVAIMKLYDEGKLRLDDKIEDLLPAYKVNQKFPESGPITIRSLLTHSSGLPREAAYPYWTGPDFPFPTKAEIDGKLGEQETLYPASTYFQYSNLALTLLGEIVEEISGKPYGDYINEEIIRPLGLSDTRPEMPKDLYGNQLAIGYSSEGRDGNRDKVNYFSAEGITPAAGFSSNVTDLGKFASWQFRLRDTTVVEILKPSTLKNMQRVHWMDPDWETSWGLGFSVYKGSDGNTWAGHGGSCPGYRSTLQLDLKNKRAFSVMINAGGTNPGKYTNGINGLMQKLKSNKTEDSSKDTGEIKFGEYKGFYSLKPWWGEAYVSSYDGKLAILRLPTDHPENALDFYKHIKDDTFRRIRSDDTLGETLVFIRGKNGEVTEYKSHGNFSKKIDR